MTADPLTGLLEKLCSGDLQAAERVFVTYEPYLRKVIRRRLPAHLRSRFDSLDIVQSIWADLLTGFRQAGWRFTSVAQLRAFLVKVTQNRFIDRCRQHNASLERELAFQGEMAKQAPPAHQPAPDAAAEANDMWEQMLALCPPAYQELLRLRRQGVPVAEIAARSGLHEDSVRRILRGLALQLSRQYPAPSEKRMKAVP
jgi:RNA polymerase sigma-70 factor (ECF subfamily)